MDLSGRSDGYFVAVMLMMVALIGMCANGENDGVAVGAPMAETEQQALYYAIQGFVGKWWNGSDLYPDPCGWTPIQAGQAASRAAAGKVNKHEKACIDNQHVFVPFAFDTFGHLESEAVATLRRIQKVMHGNVAAPRLKNIVFVRLGFAIQKGLAAQLVARLPCLMS